LVCCRNSILESNYMLVNDYLICFFVIHVVYDSFIIIIIIIIIIIYVF
jgi:hypothetical protein